jgi:hypothetical protein
MDGWDDRYLAQCRFCFINVFKKRIKVPDGVLGGYFRGTIGGSEYLEGTAKEIRVVMFD